MLTIPSSQSPTLSRNTSPRRGDRTFYSAGQPTHPSEVFVPWQPVARKRRCNPRGPEAFRGMTPEERVNLALELSSAIDEVTLDNVRDTNPGISQKRLVELGRKRFKLGRRTS